MKDSISTNNEGLIYGLDDDGHARLIHTGEQLKLTCGDVCITIAPNLIDMQFGERDDILFSANNGTIQYCKFPASKEYLAKDGVAKIPSDRYKKEDLTENFTTQLQNPSIMEIFSTCVGQIEDEKDRENVLQEFNYILAKANMPTITHIPDARDLTIAELQQKIEGLESQLSQAKETIKEGNEEITVLRADNQTLRGEKSHINDDLKAEKTKSSELTQQNSELRGIITENRNTAREMFSKIPFIGKKLAKRYASTTKDFLPEPRKKDDFREKLRVDPKAKQFTRGQAIERNKKQSRDNRQNSEGIEQ